VARKALGVFVFVLIISACSHGSGGNGTANPFLGTWKSDEASDGTRLTFIGNADGTFKYEMEGVPTEMGLPDKGNGVYIIREDMLVAYFDFGLVKGIVFDVLDNNTIDTNEFTLDTATGAIRPSGEIVPFRRIGEASGTSSQPTILPNNVFIGNKKWSANIPEPEDTSGNTFYPSEWKFRNDGTVSCTFIGLGPALGFPNQEDAPFDFSYVISDNILVLFAESWGAYEIRIFQFTIKNASTVNMKQFALLDNFVTFTDTNVIANIDYRLIQ
jgi:hypothetical protein